MLGRGLPNLRLAAKRVTDELQRTHPVLKSARWQPVGFYVALLCMLATIQLMHKHCAVMAEHAATQYLTAQISIAQESTAQRGTSQHNTVQHSAVQRSAAQHSIV